MFKVYGCGCIGIPVHSTPDYKQETALVLIPCDEDRYALPGYGLSECTFTNEGERNQLAKAYTIDYGSAEYTQLVKGVRYQLWDGSRMAELRRLIAPIPE